MKSYSQAGQDVFVRLILGENHKGNFIDIGCAGEMYSNTLALEQEGWTGWLVDIDPNAGNERRNPFINRDATKVNWYAMELDGDLPNYVDYLSLDVDENSLAALKNLPLDRVRFGIITIEHDAYRFGDKLRPGERAVLMAHGYQLICKDVCGAPGAPFEDWWVSPGLVEKAAKFATREPKLYTDILKAVEIPSADSP